MRKRKYALVLCGTLLITIGAPWYFGTGTHLQWEATTGKSRQAKYILWFHTTIDAPEDSPLSECLRGKTPSNECWITVASWGLYNRNHFISWSYTRVYFALAQIENGTSDDGKTTFAELALQELLDTRSISVVARHCMEAATDIQWEAVANQTKLSGDQVAEIWRKAKFTEQEDADRPITAALISKAECDLILGSSISVAPSR